MPVLIILALKVILLDRLQGIICSVRPYVYAVCLHLSQGAPAGVGSDNA